MKKLVLVIVIFILIAASVIFLLLPQKPLKIANAVITPSPSPISIVSKEQNALFIPYWTLSKTQISGNYDSVIYFGIAANEKGIDTKEAGYLNIHNFISLVPSGSKIILTIRMTNTSSNIQIFQNSLVEKSIINDSIALAKLNKFDGILLDLEHGAIGFDSVTKDVTDFSTEFAKKAKSSGLLFYQSLYGDTYYRVRPYDVKKIANASDGVMVMAYDLHKAGGDSGPNFPLKDNDDGYDFKKMISDFSKDVAINKLTVIFGLFGYDWKVDNKNRSTGEAQPLTDNEIEEKFLPKCIFKNCNIIHDKDSSETEITYIDKDGSNHIVWFEDQNSMNEKEKYLKTKGVNSTALWAWGYF